MLSVTEFDRALTAGRVELGRWNARPVRCCVEGCRVRCEPLEAQELWIDGQRRGYGCSTCTSGLR